MVHNGIIENFRELREKLQKKGAVFETETDTEQCYIWSTAILPPASIRSRRSKPRCRSFAAPSPSVLSSQADDDILIGARNGPPLAIGYGDGEMYLGSDAIALGPFTDSISYLEDGDWAVLTRDGATVYDQRNAIVHREVVKHSASTSLVDKANYRHFMAKEIHEQPEVVGHTLARYLDLATERVSLPVDLPFDFREIKRMSITACGTAYLCRLHRQILAGTPGPACPSKSILRLSFAIVKRRSTKAI